MRVFAIYIPIVAVRLTTPIARPGKAACRPGGIYWTMLKTRGARDVGGTLHTYAETGKHVALLISGLFKRRTDSKTKKKRMLRLAM